MSEQQQGRVAELLGLSAQAREFEERCVLRAIMLDPAAAFEHLDRFLREDFDDRAWRKEEHRATWRAMRACRDSGSPVTPSALAQAVMADEKIARLFADELWGDHEANARRFLVGLVSDEGLSPLHVTTLADHLSVMHVAELRDRLRTTSLALAEGRAGPEAVREVLEGLDAGGLRGGPVEVWGERGSAKAIQAWQETSDDGKGSGDRRAIPWRICPLFDRRGAFLREGDFPVLAARPGVGKTSFALMLARLTAGSTKRPVIYVSLESGATELWQKVLCAESGVPDPGDQVLAPEALARLEPAAEYLSRIPLVIVDNAPKALPALKSYLTSLAQRNRPVLVVLDYLGLVQSKGEEYERVTRASVELRAWALANCTMLCVHQLNRLTEHEREQGQPRRPRLSDLRGSGQIEQDATHVVLLHPLYAKPEDEQQPNVEVAAILAKARRGQAGLYQRMRFDKPRSIMLPLAIGGEGTP